MKEAQEENLTHERTYCEIVACGLKCLEVSTSQGGSVSELLLYVVWPQCLDLGILFDYSEMPEMK